MSFILDALKKSESERQHDSGPSLARIPEAVPRRGVPRWAIGTMAVLGVSVVMLAGAWWRSAATTPDAGTAASRSGEVLPASSSTPPATLTGSGEQVVDTRPSPALREGAGVAEPQRPIEDEPRSPEHAFENASGAAGNLPAAANISRPTEPTRRSTLREAAAVTSTPAAAGGNAAQPLGSDDNATAAVDTTRVSRATTSPATDPNAERYSTIASQLGLPPLRLELLAYSDDPSSRYAFINGKRYREGDTLAQGPRVLAINPQGAVLLAGGRQLQLTQE